MAISYHRGKRGITGKKIIEEKLIINKEADKWLPTETIWFFQEKVNFWIKCVRVRLKYN